MYESKISSTTLFRDFSWKSTITILLLGFRMADYRRSELNSSIILYRRIIFWKVYFYYKFIWFDCYCLDCLFKIWYISLSFPNPMTKSFLYIYRDQLTPQKWFRRYPTFFPIYNYILSLFFRSESIQILLLIVVIFSKFYFWISQALLSSKWMKETWGGKNVLSDY